MFAIRPDVRESGKGWFWEVGADGCLTYFSGFGGEAAESASVVGRRLADLATDCWDEGGQGIGSERTLGFYLTRALPFTDLTVRSAEDPDVLWDQRLFLPGLAGARLCRAAGRTA
ncbi:MAG: hypothetical protein ACXWUQ_01035 [Allosphingosinicella sp.]